MGKCLGWEDYHSGPGFTDALVDDEIACPQTVGGTLEQLRTDVGLSKSKKNPLLDGMFSEDGNLAMFSQHFAGPQPDWPNKTRATGFLFHDKGREAGQDCMSPELTRFLEAGERRSFSRWVLRP